jgi:poly-gamma-glutamate synthesis protein (capsule biosynthesis protein)
LEALEGMPVAHALSAEQADIRLGTEGDWPLSETIYAVAMPFPSVVDSVSLAELRQIWEGHHPSLGPLWVPQGEEDVLRALIGPRGDAGLRLAPLEDLLERTWGAPGSLALTPFPALQPRWKVLALGGISPLAGDFDAASYALSYRLGITASPELAGALQEALGLPPSNRDPQRMTSLVLTGVTALTRVTAWKMQVNGVHYPGALVRRWLQEADYAHISHEVSFSPQCPDPNPSRLGTRFCSDTANLELFPYLGVDIVELTGNHLLDYGVEPFLETLALYEEAGMKVYGGGVNLEQARQPLLLEHNGNRLALLGCNSAGPPSVWATAERPGAAPCDMDALAAEIGRLRQQGYLVVVTFQWHEYALTVPPAGQKRGFRRAAEAGAVVVSGSQAHQPQTMEFFGDSFIHYGLGNLFFDQMWLAARREFIDRYVFYDGRLLSVELLTAMLEDFAQPRPMDPQERREFLAQIFRASGW